MSALADYTSTVELGLSVCFRDGPPMALMGEQKRKTPAKAIGAVVFGSDQGLVGQFNEVIVDYAVNTLGALPGQHRVWAVGERVQARLADAGLPLLGFFPVPNSVRTITPLVGRILLESDTHRSRGEIDELHLFYNRPRSRTVYAPVNQRLLPLDEIWRSKLATLPWPTENLPEVIGSRPATLRALIHEYLFVSLFRACAESLASEAAWPPCNAPRRTSTNCWRTSTGASTRYANVASTRSCSTSSPALRPWPRNETPLDTG